MQVLLLILGYVLSAALNHRPFPTGKKFFPPDKSSLRKMMITQAVLSAIIGIISVMLLDLSSEGEPFWPAFALLTVTAAEIFTFGKGRKRGSGVFSYFGGIFYLNPTLALICFGLAFEIGIVGKSKLLATLVFIGLVPVLIWYAQMNSVFLWIAVATELLIIWGLKAELWNRIKESYKKSG